MALCNSSGLVILVLVYIKFYYSRNTTLLYSSTYILSAAVAAALGDVIAMENNMHHVDIIGMLALSNVRRTL